MSAVPVLELREYGEGTVVLDQAAMQRLRRSIQGRLTIAPDDAPDHWIIRASSHVGTVSTPELRILIRPKVSTANLFHLLESSGRKVPLDAAVFAYEQEHDLTPAFATFFTHHLEAALIAGLHREYHERIERLVGVRGRVDLPAQRGLAGLAIPTVCRFDEYTPDTQLNRILLAALNRLRRLPGVTMSTRRALSGLATRFEDVRPHRPADLASPTSFTRLNAHYAAAERLARLVLAGSSLHDASGEATAATFLVDMNRLFQDLVESRLRRHLRPLAHVTGEDRTQLDCEGKIWMEPDLLMRRGGQIVYAADSKYKLTSTGYGRGSDYYQLLAYTTALALEEGLLVYCQVDGAAPPREVTVRNTGARLRTWAIRLDRTPSDVERELLTLRDHVAERITANLTLPV